MRGSNPMAGPRTSDSILSRRKALMDEAGLDQPQGCLKIVVKGRKNGEANSYIFSTSSRGQGMGEGTGIPAQIVPTGACRGAQLLCVFPYPPRLGDKGG